MALSGLQTQKWRSLSSLAGQDVGELHIESVILRSKKEIGDEDAFDLHHPHHQSDSHEGPQSPAHSPAPSDYSAVSDDSCSSQLDNTGAGERAGAFGSYDVTEERFGYNEEPLLTLDRDTSGYTSNTSSKDDSQQCSCSVSMRSSSPESVLSASTTNEHTIQNRDTVRKSREVSVFNKIADVNVDNADNENGRLMLANETPIEREIRLAKERELELTALRQRHLAPEYNRSPSLESGSSVSVSGKKNQLYRPKVDSATSGNRDIQKRLATTRLQQEIDEQRRRELDLRRDGRVLSTSEDHTDFIQSDESNSDNQVFQHSDRSVLQRKELLESKQVVEEPKIPRAALASNLTKYPSETNLAKSVFGNTKLAPMKIPSSMEKFFSSRGRVVPNVVSAISPVKATDSVYASSSEKEVYVDYSAVRTKADSSEPPKRTYKPAINKISQELKEMQEREEELRLTRSKLGLKVLEKGAENIDDEPAMATEESKPTPKKSNLVAQWEEKIQSHA